MTLQQYTIYLDTLTEEQLQALIEEQEHNIARQTVPTVLDTLQGQHFVATQYLRSKKKLTQSVLFV